MALSVCFNGRKSNAQVTCMNPSLSLLAFSLSSLSHQGEVEQIALMKPKAQTEHDDGMLEFLEDIIGTSRFKEPIELLSKKVEELNEARGEKVR